MPNCASSVCSSRHYSRGSIYSNCSPMPGCSLGGTGSGPPSRRSSGSRPGSRRESLFSGHEMGLVNLQEHLNENSSTSTTPPSGSVSGQANFLQTLGSGVVGVASSLYQSSITPPRYRKSFTRNYNLTFN